ncbi:MAG TPA: AcvB/VirJ family lysyl-phosphatidylglycerol hydrolase [Steroidobacteraceae bacterium]
MSAPFTRVPGARCAMLLVMVSALGAGDFAGAAPAAAVTPVHHKAQAAAKPAAKPSDGATQHLSAGRFGTVAVYLPQGRARSVAIFLSGDGGWELGVINMARALQADGAVVIGVDIREYFSSLGKVAARGNAPCQMIAADFEALSHQVQKQIGLEEYLVPVLVGYSSGATVAYATLVQSPPGTFAGALSLGFCADQDFVGVSLCPGADLHYSTNQQNELVFAPAANLKQPWIAFQGQKDEVCNPQAAEVFAAKVANGEIVRLPAVGHGFSVERNWMPQFHDAYARLSTRTQPAVAATADIGGLPLQEVHASGAGDEFALLLTGDGGWAGLDQELAARLAAAGVPTVGLNSLKYFWSPRTPEQTAQDVTRILRHYLSQWDKQRVLLVGYSFGADVLPFVVNRLPADLRQRVASVSLLGIDANASFEVRVSDWVGSDNGGPATQPELARITRLPVLCLYGAGEKDSICPGLPQGVATREQVGTGHHFGGEYATLAERILAFARKPRPVT